MVGSRKPKPFRVQAGGKLRSLNWCVAFGGVVLLGALMSAQGTGRLSLKKKKKKLTVRVRARPMRAPK